MGQAGIGIAMILFSAIGVIVMSFLIYIIIDIRDKLSENNTLLRELDTKN